MPTFAHFEILAGFQARFFLAFKLHRSISGAGNVYATLKGAGQRSITLDGQRFGPDEPHVRLYPAFSVAGVVKNIIPLFSTILTQTKRLDT